MAFLHPQIHILYETVADFYSLLGLEIMLKYSIDLIVNVKIKENQIGPGYYFLFLMSIHPSLFK